jgi:hypothetical protein
MVLISYLSSLPTPSGALNFVHTSTVSRYAISKHTNFAHLTNETIVIIIIIEGTRWRSWLRHYSTSRKVAISSPGEVIKLNKLRGF